MFSYTIIIPHKNCPDLLKRCVDSIPVRDDVQIIVVDDNSDEDKKPSIERKGMEVVLLDASSSKGAGRARNVGLKHAKGKWLLFADADDYYTDNLSKFLDKEKIRREKAGRSNLKKAAEAYRQEAEEKHLLSFATGFLILDSDTLQFDRAKVAATFGVYADTAQEVALLDKLKQLAALTNEIFGKEYPGAQVAFSAFFEMENGKVILSKNIKKETLSEYAKNM